MNIDESQKQQLMFTDNNIEFLKNFTLDDTPPEPILTPNPNPIPQAIEPRTPTQIPKPPMPHPCPQKQILNNIEQQISNNKELTQSKRIRMVNMLCNKNRKYSEENVVVKLRERDWERAGDDEERGKGIQINAKSEPSVEMGDSDGEREREIGEDMGMDGNIEKSDKSIGAKTNKSDVQNIESSYLRKIRNLEARIKNIDLNHETLVSKLKLQSQKHQTQNTQIREFLSLHHPQILQQLNAHLLVLQQQACSFSSSSSSSDLNHNPNHNRNEDQWMPVLSKIQELKYSGQKMCEKIRTLHETLTKKLQLEHELLTQRQKQLEYSPRRGLLRKYSIPVNVTIRRDPPLHLQVVKRWGEGVGIQEISLENMGARDEQIDITGV